MIVLRNKMYGWRNNIAKKLIDSSDKNRENIKKLDREFKEAQLDNPKIENKLKTISDKNGLKLVTVKSDPKYLPKSNTIQYLPKRVDSLAHELGHYNNTKSTGLRKWISDKNNTGKRQTYRSISSSRDMIKNQNLGNIKFPESPKNKSSLRKSLSSFKNGAVSGIIVKAEERNAARDGLRNLRSLGLSNEELEKAKKLQKLGYKTYKEGNKANLKLLAANLINDPEKRFPIEFC